MGETREVVDGIEILSQGEGDETIVMIHGWPDTHRLWDAQVQGLKGNYCCVRFTLPGYDVALPPRPFSVEQMVAFFKAVIDHVSPGKPVVVLMHDWGCIYGYQFVARHPELVARVIGVDIGDSNTSAYLKSLSFKAKLMIVAYQWWLALAWKLGGNLGNRMTRHMSRLLRCRADPALIGWQMNYPYYHLWTGRMREMVRFTPHCPMLYIYGARKPFMFHSPRWLEQIAALPGGAVREFPTGHWIMSHQPDAFTQCIADWLGSDSNFR
jgi:pimeloyl-ACP methyl ester carboxylesterase